MKQRYLQRVESSIRLGVAVKAGIEEFHGWSPEQIQAFLAGVGKVLAITKGQVKP